MPASTASRTRTPAKKPTAVRDAPPAKKTKLSQPASASAPRQNGFSALLNGTQPTKPAAAATVNAVRHSRKEKVDEARAVVAAGPSGGGDVDMDDAPQEEAVDNSSAAEESDDESGSEGEQEDNGALALESTKAQLVNGHALDEEPREDGTAEPEELSFGERLQAQAPEHARATHVVNVEAAFDTADAPSNSLAATSDNRRLIASSATSLGTILTQALRTNDRELLESCLRVNNVETIYATVERLPSPLVGNLLQRLAERLYRKPGRAGMLMIWVQWSLAAHGGYLASQPQLVKQLATLNKVLKERASGLQPLLSLKGRLDMLQVQLELRRRNQKQAVIDDEDEAVIYVEGEDDVSSADEDDNSVSDNGNGRKRIRQGSEDDDDESSLDEMPTTMEMDEDDDDEGSEDSDDLLDDEAEETDDDEGDDMSEPLSDDDFEGIDDASSEEESSKPARRSTAGRARY